MKIVKNVLLLVIVILMLIFALQNEGELTRKVALRMDLYVKDFSPGPVPLYAILIGSFFLGLIITGLAGWVGRLRLRNECKRLSRLLKEKDKELNSLRNLPVLESEAGTDSESTTTSLDRPPQ